MHMHVIPTETLILLLCSNHVITKRCLQIQEQCELKPGRDVCLFIDAASSVFSTVQE